MDIHGHILQFQSSGGWARGEFLCDDGKPITVTGTCIPSLTPRQRYMISGQWVEHEKFGLQFKVHAAIPGISADSKSIEKYLIKNFSRCGAGSAKTIFNAFVDSVGVDEFRRILIASPWVIAQDDFCIKKKIVFNDDFSTQPDVVTYRYLSVTIGGVISDPLLRRLSSYLSEKKEFLNAGGDGDMTSNIAQSAWKRLCEDPYKPLYFVSGYGFKTADLVAKAVGYPMDSTSRLSALAYYALRTGCENYGHVFLKREQFNSAVKSTDPLADPDLCMAAANLGMARIIEVGGAIYTSENYQCERQVEEMINKVVEPFLPIYRKDATDLRFEIDSIQKSLGVSMDNSQVEAISSILTSPSRLHTLTAGPGYGKTTIMEVIALLLPDENISFAAPTGKAAKVLNERIQKHGFFATTIHRLLEPTKSINVFKRNSDNPLESTLVVIDESSMIDMDLVHALLKSLRQDCHLLLVGDADQLASVGAGQILLACMKICEDNNRLTKVYRNSGNILKAVNLSKDGKLLEGSFGDYVYIGGIGSADSELDSVISKYISAINSAGIEKTGLIFPKRKGSKEVPGWNITYINHQLQSIVNGKSDQIQGTRFRVGDRVIVRRNSIAKPVSPNGLDYDFVVNGDTGFIHSPAYDKYGGIVSVNIDLDDARSVTFPADMLDSIELAYAITTHSSQGSQYEEVIFVVTPGLPTFINRSLVYTGMSRAQRRLILMSEGSAAMDAIQRPAPLRNQSINKLTRVEYA